MMRFINGYKGLKTTLHTLPLMERRFFACVFYDFLIISFLPLLILLKVKGLCYLYDTLKRSQWLVFSFILLDVKLPKMTHHWTKFRFKIVRFEVFHKDNNCQNLINKGFSQISRIVISSLQCHVFV